MDEKLNLLNLMISPTDSYKTVAQSEKIEGYFYVVSKENYQKLSSIFGKEGESDFAFDEDSREWLVVLFDCLTFDDFEEMVISYFGSPQKTVEALSLMNAAETNKTTNFDEININLDGTVYSIDDNNIETTEQRNALSIEVINYLKGIDNINIKTSLLSVLTRVALEENIPENIISNMFSSVIESFIKSYEEIPVQLNEFFSHFMVRFEEIIGGSDK